MSVCVCVCVCVCACVCVGGRGVDYETLHCHQMSLFKKGLKIIKDGIYYHRPVPPQPTTGGLGAAQYHHSPLLVDWELTSTTTACDGTFVS